MRHFWLAKVSVMPRLPGHGLGLLRGGWRSSQVPQNNRPLRPESSPGMSDACSKEGLGGSGKGLIAIMAERDRAGRGGADKTNAQLLLLG